MNAQRLSNLQIELLKLYSTNLSQDDLLELKRILARYFANHSMGNHFKFYQD
ncbi:MAG TPA: hypothetical protein VK469_13545 [Candidatus Kapabacteria bacterium]|nr:hypothetical protein [Candidatus Kapabacteria bacterium]